MREGGAAGGRSQVFNIVERGRQRESGGVAVVIDLRSTSALEPTGNFIRNQQGEREREIADDPQVVCHPVFPAFIRFMTGGCCMDFPISYQPCQLLFLIYDFMKAPTCQLCNPMPDPSDRKHDAVIDRRERDV